MTAKSDGTTCLKVGDLQIDIETASVIRNGKHIDMPDLSYLLLLNLALEAPNIVSREKLIELVWKGKIVSDETVHQRVKLLRQAIGDSSLSPQYVSNVRGKGYRVIAQVKQLNQPLLSASHKENQTEMLKTDLWLGKRSFNRIIAVLVLSVTFYLSYGLIFDQPTTPVKKSTQAAIADLSGNPIADDFLIRAVKSINYMTQHDEEENFDRIIIFLKNAIELQPDFALAHARLAQVYQHKVDAFNGGDDISQLAHQFADKAILLAKQQQGRHSALAFAYGVKKMQDETLEAFLNSIKSNPNDYRSYVSAAFIYRSRQAYNDALELYYEAIKIDPKPGIPYIFSGAIFDKLNLPEFAESWLIESLKRAPENNSVRFGLCRLYIGMGNYPKAIQMCESMLNWDWSSDDEIEAFEWAGEAALNAGLIEKGINYYRKSMDLGSNYSKFRYASLIIKQEPKLANQLLSESLVKMQDWIKKSPDDWGNYSNLSEYYAATDNSELAYFWLEKAIEYGYKDYRLINHTSSYQKIKTEQRFIDLIDDLEKNSRSAVELIDKNNLVTPDVILKSIY